MKEIGVPRALAPMNLKEWIKLSLPTGQSARIHNVMPFSINTIDKSPLQIATKWSM